jgi:hypothetical protein
MSNEATINGLKAAGLFTEGGGPAPVSQLFFDLLADAEGRYGARDMSWTLGGINYRPGITPTTTAAQDGRKIVVICLTQDAINDPVIQRWQISHEIIHFLRPTVPFHDTTIFEEGLASYNQFFTSSAGYTGENLFRDLYQSAFDLVRPLVERHPDGVKSLRAKSSSLSPLEPALVLKHFPTASHEAANRLCERFYN